MRNIKYIVFSLLVLTSLNLMSQESKQVRQQRKVLEKQEIEKKKAQEKSIEEGKKRHENIQTKATKKRMKQSAKKSAKTRGEKKKFFLFRIFSKN
ncbi:MAG: hypothetical protein CVT95_07030 [Bacteroidetes bacterium HGW-Bacteroidetes-12]|jgi:membrane protein involved in colicin uptake|nr:MAG: hypothetical protein CVT95_07030 [Bacteroidetes bacterium HGW-Bacteroidetes-12]